MNTMWKALVAGLFGLAMFALGFSAQAEDKIPKDGKFKAAYATIGTYTYMEVPGGGFATWSSPGLMWVLDGKMYMPHGKQDCIGYTAYNTQGGKWTGYCSCVDKDGDKVLVMQEGTEAPDQSYSYKERILGGTGKYTGITGSGTGRGTNAYPPPKGDGTFQGEGVFEEEWKLP
jgi:hypothetical protein